MRFWEPWGLYGAHAKGDDGGLKVADCEALKKSRVVRTIKQGQPHDDIISQAAKNAHMMHCSSTTGIMRQMIDYPMSKTSHTEKNNVCLNESISKLKDSVRDVNPLKIKINHLIGVFKHYKGNKDRGEVSTGLRKSGKIGVV